MHLASSPVVDMDSLWFDKHNHAHTIALDPWCAGGATIPRNSVPNTSQPYISLSTHRVGPDGAGLRVMSLQNKVMISSNEPLFIRAGRHTVILLRRMIHNDPC